ncbi:MAG TPA: ergothioneine biosynthesis protein EgtC [Actinomycetota bacterium]
MLAYLGPAVTLEELLLAPEHSLLRQSWAPRYQTHGVVNADGFGVGWYDRARRAEPAVYRRAQPMWSDRTFAGIAPMIASDAVCAAVRSATPGFPVDESSVAPFASGPWLFAHNGAVEGWHHGVNVDLRAQVSRARAAAIETGVDSEVLFALALDRLDAGEQPAEALAAVVATVKGLSGGRLTMLLTDGTRIAATVYGASLFTRAGDATVVASEPFDDDKAWRHVPDLSVVTAGANEIAVDSL